MNAVLRFSFRLTPLAAAIVLLNGCTTYRFTVDAIKSVPDTAFSLSYRLRSAHPHVTEDDARFREAAELVTTALSSKGMFEAPAGVTPDMIVEIDFGINSERIEQWIEPDSAQPSGDVLITVVLYEKFARITARETATRAGDHKSREAWSVYVTNENQEADLKKYLPLLVSAAMDSIGADTKGQTQIALRGNDERVVFVKAGM